MSASFLHGDAMMALRAELPASQYCKQEKLTEVIAELDSLAQAEGRGEVLERGFVGRAIVDGAVARYQSDFCIEPVEKALGDLGQQYEQMLDTTRPETATPNQISELGQIEACLMAMERYLTLARIATSEMGPTPTILGEASACVAALAALQLQTELAPNAPDASEDEADEEEIGVVRSMPVDYARPTPLVPAARIKPLRLVA